MTEKHQPTPITRNLVETHTAVGTTQEVLASIMGISLPTLRLHYRKELDEALAKANAAIGGALYKKAIGGDNASMIFWMKTRAKWRETHRLEHSGPDGGPMQMLRLDPEQLKEMEPDELAALERAFGKLQRGTGNGADGEAGEAGGD